MHTRRSFLQFGSLGLLSIFIPPISIPMFNSPDFEGMIVNENEGEAYQLRDGRAIVKIKISKQLGSDSISYLASSIPPGDVIPVHKHLNEDEFIFMYKGSGIFTLGENEYPVSEGAIIIVPRGIWHGIQNNGNENIEWRFGYTPAGFEGFFREVGSPLGKPFIEKTLDERKAIAKKWGMLIKQ